ncbi:MAG: arsenate reductase [Alteromonas macleodii]|jgi:arsenate reductase
MNFENISGFLMRFFSLKSCNTCQKALKELADRHVKVIDVRADVVSDTDRAAMIEAFGDKVINTRSTTWRGLSEVERASDLAMLLSAYPTLMKRPVIEIEGAWYQGWTPTTKAAVGF